MSGKDDKTAMRLMRELLIYPLPVRGGWKVRKRNSSAASRTIFSDPAEAIISVAGENCDPALAPTPAEQMET